MAQKISIEPELWIRVRHLAFDRGISASALVADALTRYLDDPESGGSKLRGYTAEHAETAGRLRPVWADPFMVDDPAAREPSISIETHATATVNGPADEPPPDGWLATDRAFPAYEHVPEGFEPPHVAADLGVSDEVEVFGVPVMSPADVDKAVARATPREFRPVPKPTAKKKASRKVRA